MSILEATNISKSFPIGGGHSVRAVIDLSLQIDPGSACAVVGESGSGKSTLGRLVAGLIKPDAGLIEIEGQSISELDKGELKALRKRVTMVFQEPYQSLNPGLSVGRNVDEPLRIHRPDLSKEDRKALVVEALEEVGLDASMVSRRPVALSGGQQQRVGIARAIVTRPALMVLDEPTASLDVSVRAQIWELVARLRVEAQLSMMVITHDFETVEALCDQVVVMQSGSIVEAGRVSDIVHSPREDYTKELLDARMLPPELPRPINPEAVRAHLVLLRASQSGLSQGEIPGPAPIPVSQIRGVPAALGSPSSFASFAPTYDDWRSPPRSNP
jgi:ABC-type microcin C transport system duplicated ATPase subunit YejF